MQNLIGHITHQLFVADSQVNCPYGSGSACTVNLPTTSTNGALSTALTVIFGILGVVCVVVVVVGGLQFIMSQGDPQSAARARMTIIYAVVGLIVSISAEVIVGFVLGKF
jgi:Type IV secretion system pilin